MKVSNVIIDCLCDRESVPAMIELDLTHNRRRLHYGSAIVAGSQIFVFVKAFENALKLGRDVCQFKIFFVEFFVAVFAEPHQTVFFAVAAFAFDDESDRVCAADGIMRNSRREQENLAFADGNVDGFAVFLDFDENIAFELVEKFLAFVVMIILARIRSADDLHDKFRVFVNEFVPDGRFQQMSVFVNPLFEVKRSSDWHNLYFNHETARKKHESGKFSGNPAKISQTQRLYKNLQFHDRLKIPNILRF